MLEAIMIRKHVVWAPSKTRIERHKSQIHQIWNILNTVRSKLERYFLGLGRVDPGPMISKKEIDGWRPYHESH